MKAQHQDEIDNLDKTTASRIKKVKEDCENDKKQSLEALSAKHAGEIKDLKKEHELSVRTMEVKFDERMANAEKMHRDDV